MEEIDSSCWPKMHFMYENVTKNFGRALRPSFGQNPKERQLFSRNRPLGRDPKKHFVSLTKHATFWTPWFTLIIFSLKAHTTYLKRQSEKFIFIQKALIHIFCHHTCWIKGRADRRRVHRIYSWKVNVGCRYQCKKYTFSIKEVQFSFNVDMYHDVLKWQLDCTVCESTEVCYVAPNS